MLNYFLKVKESGAAIPAVIMAMIASGALITTLSGTLNNREIEGVRTNMKVFQRLIHTKVLSAASNPINIYKSIDDENFKNCIEIQDYENIEDDPVDCFSTDYETFDAEMFYDGKDGSTVISGYSVAYNIRGVLCPESNTPNCPFEVITAYKINCFDGNAECNVAESISVRAQVVWLEGFYMNQRIDSQGNLKIASFPKQDSAVRESGLEFPETPEIFVSTVFPSDISENMFQQCPKYSNAIGYTGGEGNDGAVLECACAPGYKSVGGRGVKLACESDLPANIVDGDDDYDVETGAATGNTGTYNTVITKSNSHQFPGNRGSVKCKKSKYHKLVSISNLKSTCKASNPQSKDSRVHCSDGGNLSYTCKSFKEETRWAN